MTTPKPLSERSLRAVLVDDERLARRALATLLAQHPDVEVVGEAGRVAEAAALVEQFRPDVVFLDIQLRGETGFDVLAHLDAETRVIFVTAFDAYAVRAFEVNALDYLLKPIDPDRLAEALHRARAAAPPPPPSDETPPFEYDDLFFFEEHHRARFIRIRDIVFVQAAGNYTELHLAAGAPALVLKGLATWEAQLPDAHFVRVHRSTLVNVAFVERVERAPNYTYELYLRGRPAPLIMSRRRAAVLKRRLA